jgi:hypothetical protein
VGEGDTSRHEAITPAVKRAEETPEIEAELEQPGLWNVINKKEETRTYAV